jgi:predicted RNA polymerase sigma factor
LKSKDAWVRGQLCAKLGMREAAEYAYHEALSIYESLPIAPELPELRAEIKRVLGGL